MFEKIISSISQSSHVLDLADTISYLHELVRAVEENYEKDDDMKNAVLDTLCQVLQQHKTKVP